MMKMLLNTLLSACGQTDASDCWVSGITNDSRQVSGGDVFLAYPGALADGRHYIPQVLAQGAAAIIYELSGSEAFHSVIEAAKIPMVAVEGLAAKIGYLAGKYYGDPSYALEMIGITGTSGKTSIAYQLAEAKSLLGQKSAYIGTLGMGQVPHITPSANTTPDGLSLQRYLHEAQQQACVSACVEVTSHALEMGRVAGLHFDQAIFTNLSHEHLDYHHTMEAYAAAKARLFAREGLKHVILNQDDAASIQMQSMVKDKTTRVWHYGLGANAAISATQLQFSAQGTSFQLNTPWGNGTAKIRAIGQVNVYNTLAIVSSLLCSDLPFQEVVDVLPCLATVPGRMETLSLTPWVLVDYSHKPDALAQALQMMRRVHTKGRLIVVFGCGGERDREKRPVMGKIATQYADVVILTNDNPRHEDPDVILQEIEKGLLPGKMVYKVPDRQLAIEKALALAGQEDAILVAGKGHEAYQETGEGRRHFSDQAVIREFLRT